MIPTTLDMMTHALHALDERQPRNLRRYPPVLEADNHCLDCGEYAPVCQCVEFEQPEPEPRRRRWDEIEADAAGVPMRGEI